MEKPLKPTSDTKKIKIIKKPISKSCFWVSGLVEGSLRCRTHQKWLLEEIYECRIDFEGYWVHTRSNLHRNQSISWLTKSQCGTVYWVVSVTWWFTVYYIYHKSYDAWNALRTNIAFIEEHPIKNTFKKIEHIFKKIPKM